MIGFCGGPFTVAGYLVEGRPSREFGRTKAMMLGQPDVWRALLDKLADFLLQSGFAGGDNQSYYGWDAGDENNRSLDTLKQAILDALMESGQFTPEMLEALRGGELAPRLVACHQQCHLRSD